MGRRLALDGEKWRLWVVCPKCLRWNLTPLEEGWEAIEECERIFRDTPVRVSTENIGIARHPEGLELVRIGKARRREFAAWRYMQRFRRRYFRDNALLVPYAAGAPWAARASMCGFSCARWAGSGLGAVFTKVAQENAARSSSSDPGTSGRFASCPTTESLVLQWRCVS